MPLLFHAVHAKGPSLAGLKIKRVASQTLLTVQVKPNSRKPRLEANADGIAVCVRAPAIDGRANDACLRALAEALSIPKRAVALVSGIRSRQKRIRICGLTKDECLRRLA